MVQREDLSVLNKKWIKKNASEDERCFRANVHQFRKRSEQEACFRRKGMLQRGFPSVLKKYRIGSMLWKRRDALEKIFINLKNKKHALEEEGCFKEDVHQFRMRTKSEKCFGRGGMVLRGLSTISNKK